MNLRSRTTSSTVILALLSHAANAILWSEAMQMKDKISGIKIDLSSRTPEEIAAISAEVRSVTDFMDELSGLTQSSGGNVTNAKIPVPIILESVDDVDRSGSHERRTDTTDTIRKREMKQFSIFSNMPALNIKTSDLVTGTIILQTGKLYDQYGYIAGDSDLICTGMFEDTDQDGLTDQFLCSAIFIFANKYGFEVGQLHLQGIVSGLTVTAGVAADGTANANRADITNTADIFSVIGGTGCFAGAKGLATFDGLAAGSIWYTKKHDVFLYEYWEHEYNNPTDTYPF
eukprot:CAMPEP_0194358104 /NCGR_PEP_ID=MMETSP0174-20130528/5437_1 /TAXON_ID=216777 /ORGANISM="Proboscia alata, Strain PI-D3" /LENGTH=286 /DNA_ID=CAMNT_0039128341 /DNA_START=53 /DNA_END=913 /DNA_ORIENTATION=+